MKSKPFGLCLIVCAVLFCLIQTAEAGRLRRLLFFNYSGSNITNLYTTNNLGVQTFPTAPDAVDYIPFVEQVGQPPNPPFLASTGTNVVNGAATDNYGSLIQGYLTAPETGNYIFWLATDDEGELYLTTDSTDPLNPAKTNRVCWVPGWSGPGEWTKFPEQQSAPVSLEAGKTYYLEIRHKEGTGGDHIVIGWQTPSGIIERPMPAWHFQPVKYTGTLPGTAVTEPNVEIVAGPAYPSIPGDYNIYDGNYAVVYANVNLDQPVTYQWYRDNVLVLGATNGYYLFRANMTDNNTSWTVQARSGGTTYTPGFPATIYVSQDKPQVVSAAVAPQNPTLVQVVFSEDVNPLTATNFSSYTLSGATIQSITLASDNRSVSLKTSLLTPTRVYTLTVQNVQDMATPPNTMDTVSTNFIIADGSINFRIFVPTIATDLTTLSNATRIGGTTSTAYNNDQFTTDQIVTTTSIGWNVVPARDNFTGQMIGYLTAPETGNYKFAIASDDHSMLYLGTSDQRSSKRQICNYNGSTGRWNLGQQLANQQSATISLTAGQRYYIEAVFRDGTGGDGVTVCWQTPSDTLNGRTMPTANESVQANTEPFLIPAKYLSRYSTFGEVFFRTNLPATLSAAAGTRPVLRVTVDGTQPYNYQWFRNGTAIQGATTSAYTVPFLTEADNSASFSVTVTNNFSTTNSVATVLTVTADAGKPTIASVGSVYKQTVDVQFSEPVTAQTATNTANYLLFDSTGAAVQVNTAVLDTNNLVKVTLQTAPMPETDLMKLVVQNVADTSPAANVINPATNTFRANNFEQVVSINNSQPWNISATGSQIQMTAGGGDIWGNADAGLFAYKSVTGNFDYKVQGVSINAPNTWTKMGVMVRATTAAGSRNLYNLFTAPSPNQNTYSAQVRDTTGGASTSSNDAGTPLYAGVQPGVTARPTLLTYPSWVRIQRIGNTFYFYYGQNGTNWTYWTYYDSTLSGEGALPSTVLVGLAFTSHDSAVVGDGTMATFMAVNDGPLAFTLQPTNTTAVEGGNVTFTSAVTGSTPYYYQWFTNGVAMTESSVTNANLSLTRVPYTWNGVLFSVRVTNPYGQTINSTNALLTVVQDTNAPTVRFWALPKVNINPTEVKLLYSEYIDRGTAEAINNYQITTVPGGATLGISSAYLDADERTIVLTTSPQQAGMTYKVVVNNVKDQACCPPNFIAPNSTDYFYYAGTSGNFAQRTDGYIVMEAEDGVVEGNWQLSTVRPDYSSRGYMVVPNGAGTGGTAGTSPNLYGTGAKLSYNIVFNRTGRHIIWIRGWNESATAGNDDSVYLGFNDDGVNDWMVGMSSDVNQSQLSGWSGTTWSWRSDRNAGSDPLTFTNTTTGLHKLIIWQREDGTLIDKIVIESGTRAAGNTAAPAPATSNGGIGDPATWDWIVAPPAAPTIALITPTNTQAFAAGANIPMEATVAGPSPIATVEFLVGTNVVGKATSAPWAATWASVPEGLYTLTARVTDVLGYQVTSAAVNLVVDSTKPIAYAVGSLGGTSIGVYFSDLSGLDPVSAADVAHYSVNGGSIPVTAASLEVDKLAVMLTLASPVTGAFSVQVANVADRGFGPNLSDSVALSSTVVSWPLHSDIGPTNASGQFTDPLMPGLAQAVGTDGFYVRAGGHDIWDSADGMHFVYLPVTGNFDVSVRVASLLRPNEWSKAGIMVREDLAGDARNFLIASAPTNGQNLITVQWRPVKAGASASIATADRPTPTPIPNAWLRMTRTNDTYTVLWGTNGTTWRSILTTNWAFGATPYVGLATTSHDNGTNLANITAAYYRNVTGLAPSVMTPPPLTYQVTAQGLVLSWPAENIGMRLETQTGGLSGSWTPVPGSTTVNTITVPINPASGSVFYRLAYP